MSGYLKISISVGLIGIVVFLDQLSKSLIRSQLALGESKSIIPDLFDLTYIQNPGAAFGFMGGINPSLRLGLFILIYIFVGLFAFFRLRIAKRNQEVIALSLLVGGAIGNACDRFRDGFVTDFLDFYYTSYHYPSFNLADVAICVAVVTLLLSEFVDRKHSKLIDV